MANLKITEVSITLSPDGRTGKPHLQTWSDGWRHLSLMFLYAPKWLFFLAGIASILSCLIEYILILLGTFWFFGLGFNLNTLLTCSVFIIATQSISFWLFSHLLAVKEGLLTPDPFLKRFTEWLNLEKRIIAGALSLLTGSSLFFKNGLRFIIVFNCLIMKRGFVLGLDITLN